MFKKIMLSMVCLCALTVTPSKADDVVFGPLQPMLFWLNNAPDESYGPYQPSESVFETQSLLYQTDQEFSFQFAGKKEEGALRFFVAKDSFSVEEHPLYTEGLNAISPAAGIQFTIDFNL